MMQQNEIRQRFQSIEQSIHHAADACAHTDGVPMDLKDCIQQMDQQTAQAMQVMHADDPQQMMDCVDQLEEMGDRAKDACARAGNVNADLRDAVMQAHRQLSDLKHQLH